MLDWYHLCNPYIQQLHLPLNRHVHDQDGYKTLPTAGPRVKCLIVKPKTPVPDTPCPYLYLVRHRKHPTRNQTAKTQSLISTARIPNPYRIATPIPCSIPSQPLITPPPYSPKQRKTKTDLSRRVGPENHAVRSASIAERDL